MALSCDRCAKTYDHGNKVSHAKNRTKTLRMPNLHRANVRFGDVKVKMKLCTKCIRVVRAAQKTADTAN